MWIFFYPGLLWIGKIRKDDPSHGAGQLIQHAAGFSEICIFRILADLRQLRRCQTTAIFPVQDGRHPHLKSRRAGKPAAPEHVAGGIGIEAPTVFPCARKPSAMPRIRLAEWVLSPC